MAEPVLVSVHIPKTAGSSFRELLLQVFQDQLILDYDDRPLSRGARWRQLKGRLLGRPLIPLQTRCIHGHYIATKYQRRLAAARYAVWVRDPIERVASHYHYALRNPNPKNSNNRQLHKRHLDLVGFARLDKIRDVQTRFLGSMPIESFDFVGITEYSAESLLLFRSIFGGADDFALPRTNVNPQRSYVGYQLERRVQSDIEQCNRKDIQLYARANQRFRELCALYDVSLAG